MGLFDRVKKIKSKEFMEAVSAASAMVAYADGLATPEELEKLIEYIRLDEALKVFDAGEVIQTFERYVESFEFDLRIGREKAMKAVRRLPPRTEEARLLILLSCAIGQADLEFDNNERLVIREICQALGFHPNEFDLNLRAPNPSDIPRATKPQPRKEDLPEWMRNTANLPKPPPIPSEKPPKKKNAPVVESADIPDWMREPIQSPENPKKEEADLPDWMRNPPDLKKSSGSGSELSKPRSRKNRQPEDLEAMPEWMRNPSKAFKRMKKEGNIPEWMRKNLKK
ncbi:MAG: tellurite resistance TerB family protein [Thermodesulfobacteriota bacterium]